ncbi:hypothetical protein [Brevibacillus borstelensis]|uniref:hypothetical protein n=1 Tax=Brevibacillus borstelensis TaxID=45462 RepID=UPI0030BF4A0B
MGLFSRFFSRHKSLVYIAIGAEAYAQVVARLQAHGVSYRTKSPIDMGGVGMDPAGSLFPRTDRTTTYEIYVRPEDEHKAYRAIHGR